SNPSVLLPQLACAAYERPLTPDDEPWWGDDLADGVRQLVLGDRLRLRNGAAYWQGRGTPAPGIGLRSGSPDEFRSAEPDGRVVGTVDGSRAFEQVHPGAIYLHLGQQYRVVTLDLDDRVASSSRSWSTSTPRSAARCRCRSWAPTTCARSAGPSCSS